MCLEDEPVLKAPDNLADAKAAFMALFEDFRELMGIGEEERFGAGIAMGLNNDPGLAAG